MEYKDLPTLRDEVHMKVANVPRSIVIPEDICNKLQAAWDRCKSFNNTTFFLNSEGGEVSLTHRNVILAAIGSILTSEYKKYKAVYAKIFSNLDIRSERQKSIFSENINYELYGQDINRIKAAISDLHLDKESEERILKFAFDNNWSGCSKGIGRSSDYFKRAVCLALHTNPTNDPMLATVSDDFLSSDEMLGLRDNLIKISEGTFIHHPEGTNPIFTKEDKVKLREAIKATGFQAKEELIERVVNSLVAKPFLILTGNSGTGKTKLAELVAARLSGKDAHVTMAVGAGWTDNRNVVGFVNFLRTDTTKGLGEESSQQLPLYQSTPILNLLLRADKNPDDPHFLILDEMNLSHVERYFADFLSAMESTKGLIHLHSEGDEETLLAVVAGGEPVVPRRLAFPKNVFVIGTVNVDETTYMFSPKVLDRANVIEFRTGKTQIGKCLSDGGSVVSEITPGGESEQRGFLQLAKAVRSGTVDRLDADISSSIGEALTMVFDIMADARLEFGFRTIKEIIAYDAVDHALSGNKAAWKWEPIFDLQLLQKVLPKLHGSKRRLEALLLRLTGFCETGVVPAKDASYPEDLTAVGKVKYPLS